jgi:hypothetical protein
MPHLRDILDTVLVEKMLQIKLPAAHIGRIPAGEAQDFDPIRRAATKRLTVLRTARRRATPLGSKRWR